MLAWKTFDPEIALLGGGRTQDLALAAVNELRGMDDVLLVMLTIDKATQN